MDSLDHLSNTFDGSSDCNHKLKKPKQLQTVEIKVKIDCEGCERRIRRCVERMKGVTSVSIEPKQHKLTVIGYVIPEKVAARVWHRTGQEAELWPYVPYDLVADPDAAGVHDKKAPAGYVRNVEDPLEVRYTTDFSDENHHPTVCSVM